MTTFPTDYYNAGGHFDSARYHEGFYGISFHPCTYGSLEAAAKACLEAVKYYKAKGLEARAIKEQTKEQVQYRLWI